MLSPLSIFKFVFGVIISVLFLWPTSPNLVRTSDIISHTHIFPEVDNRWDGLQLAYQPEVTGINAGIVAFYGAPYLKGDECVDPEICGEGKDDPLLEKNIVEEEDGSSHVHSGRGANYGVTYPGDPLSYNIQNIQAMLTRMFLTSFITHPCKC